MDVLYASFAGVKTSHIAHVYFNTHRSIDILPQLSVTQSP